MEVESLDSDEDRQLKGRLATIHLSDNMEMFLTSRAVVTAVKRELTVIVEANGDIWYAFEEELSLLVNVL